MSSSQKGKGLGLRARRRQVRHRRDAWGGLPRAWLVPASEPPRGGRAATRVVRQRSTPARQGGRRPSGKNSRGRARGGARGRLAARCGWLLQAAGNTFVRPSAAPCLAAYVAVGLQWCRGPSALVVHFRSALQRATGLHTELAATQTRRRRVASGSAAASGASSESRGKRSGLSALSSGTCSDPPSRTLSVERGSNHS